MLLGTGNESSVRYSWAWVASFVVLVPFSGINDDGDVTVAFGREFADFCG